MAEQAEVAQVLTNLMPVQRSSPLCARAGLLLLLLGLLSSLVPGAQTAPIDFVCQDRVRRDRSNLTYLLEDMLQRKRMEVVADLTVLWDGVKDVKNQSSLPCQTSLLAKLERRLKNELLIVKQFPIQENSTTASNSTEHKDRPPQFSQSLRVVLQHYKNLLQGKLEYLVADMQSSACPGHRR